MDSTGSVLLKVMERVYPLNYLKQLSNCSPVSSENISLLKLLHKTISVQAVTATLVFSLFISTFSESEPLVRDEAARPRLQVVLPQGKTQSVKGVREGGEDTLGAFLEVAGLHVGCAGDDYINPYRNFPGHGVCRR